MLPHAIKTRPCDGEVRNGDRAVVRIEPDAVLLAVVDALGHGPHAADAADVAEDVLRTRPLAGSISLLEALHASLRGGRGAAVTVVLVTATSVEIAGVGNVAFRCHGAALAYAPAAGVVGGRFRPPKPYFAPRPECARLFLASDGVTSRFDPSDYASLDVEAAAAQLFAAGGKSHDDATLIVADLSRRA